MHTDSLSKGGDSSRASERRQHSRQAPNSLAYVHLDETNGGILINLSEGGLAVQAAMSVIEDDLPRVRLQVPRSKSWLEVSARVVWTSDSRRMIGVEFLDLADDSRENLREWLVAENDARKHAGVVVPPPSEADLPDSHGPREEVRLGRPAQARTPVHRTKEADVAALLAAREAVSIAAGRTAHHGASTPAVRAKVAAAPATPPASKSQAAPSRGRYIPLIAILSVLSLASGWEIGRGSIGQIFAALFEPSAIVPVSAAGSLNARGANATSASINFEIVDASNQSWLVPFAGPTSVPQNAPLPVIPSRPAPPEDRTPAPTKPVFKVGALSAPKSASRSTTQSAAAPVLQMDSSVAIPSALGDGPSRVDLARPSTTQPSQPASTLVPAQVIRHPDPIYPNGALTQRIQGAVKVHATIEQDGSLSNVTAVSGSPLLAPAAVEAVRKWKYKPETLDGKPVSGGIDVTVQFSLPQ